MNPVPVPPHLMGTLMGLLQAQLPLQGQVQQAAPPGIAPMQGVYPAQMQLPPGMGPVFNWSGWQPAQPGMAGVPQQFQAMHQQQYMPQGQPSQMTAPQTSMNDLQAAVAAAMQQQERGPLASGSPVGSHPNDEQTLVDALKKGRADSLNPRQALEKLHKVNGHTEMEWKNYLLEHLERFYSMVYERRTEGSGSHHPVHQRGRSSTSGQGDAHAKPSQSASTSTKGMKARHSFGRRRRTPDDPSRSPSPNPVPVSGRSVKAAPPREPPASSASHAHLERAEAVVSEHAGVQIPLLPRHVKPKPPPQPALPEGSNRMGKFTKEEKIFFIQFLRWRLRKGPVPDCSELCQDLYVEAPHRSPSSWKKHWENYPQLPESILAEAKERRAAHEPADTTASRSAALAEDEEDEGDEGDEEDEEDEEDEGDVPADDTDPEDAASPRPRKRKPKRWFAPRKVTEEDIRDLAKYKLTRLHEWDELTTHRARWEDFTSKNTKRTYGAWMLVVSAREYEIDEVVRELREEQKAERHDSPPPAPAASPPSDVASTSGRPTNSVHAEQATSVLQKRDTDSRLAVRSGSPVAKRIKQEPDTEYISLLSDSD